MQPGQLSPRWSLAFGLGWVAITLGMAAVWHVGWQLGQGTWWAGPRGRTPVTAPLVMLIPVSMVLATWMQWRNLPIFGVIASFGIAVIGVLDLGDRTGLAVVQLALGLAGVMISIAARAGMYRSAPA
jgi:hypothetical protein